MAERRVTRSMTRRHGMPMEEEVDHNDPHAHMRVGPKSHRARRRRTQKRHFPRIRYNGELDSHARRARNLRESRYAAKRQTLRNNPPLTVEELRRKELWAQRQREDGNVDYYAALRRELGMRG